MKEKVVIIFLIMLLCVGSISHSKYKNIYNIEAIEIATDIEPPKYNIKYSTKSFTNKNVEIILEFSEEILEVEGFEKIDKFKYKRVLNKNENKIIQVFDLAKNLVEIEYNVNWIDKNSPKIIGVENNGKYINHKKVNYSDDLSGIKDIKKVFYGQLDIGVKKYQITDNYYEIEIEILRTPKDCGEFIFCKVNENIKQINRSKNKNFTFRVPINDNSDFYVEVLDTKGNKFVSEKINKSNIEQFINKCRMYNNEDIYTFSNPGFYDIYVIDNAGNESFCIIEIQK